MIDEKPHSIEPAKPCPFCGSDNVQFEKSNESSGDPPAIRYFIVCMKCDATGSSTPVAAEALRRWNARKP